MSTAMARQICNHSVTRVNASDIASNFHQFYMLNQGPIDVPVKDWHGRSRVYLQNIEL